MPGQGRLGDLSQIQACAHGCPACPHPAVGPAIIGSPDVNVNKMPALRVDDTGMHAICCNTCNAGHQLLTPGTEIVGRLVRVRTMSAFNSPSVSRTNSAEGGVPAGTWTGEPEPGPPWPADEL